jgi:flagellar basal-body rod modification protein FlgD
MSTPGLNAAQLLGLTSYEAMQQTPQARGGEAMGKTEFLTLFTAQLKNQNPLDPVKNEAFVAQLAQFSQLEALTNMQNSLERFVSVMGNERLLSSSALIGRSVAVENSWLEVEQGQGAEARINLPNGASGVQVTITDRMGQTVQQLVAGAQMPGEWPIRWDGTDALGNPVPTGLYRITAQAVVNGQNTATPVTTLATVESLVSQPDGAITLELRGGGSVLLSDVRRVGF